MFGGSVHTIKEEAEASLLASKKIGLEVNADKTKYIVMSRDQNTVRSHYMKIWKYILWKVEDFKYLGTNVTNQNSI
jgi:hypothetical protein